MATGGYLRSSRRRRARGEAQSSFRALQAKFPKPAGRPAPIVKRADLGAKGVYYRAMVGPFGSSGEADKFSAAAQGRRRPVLVSTAIEHCRRRLTLALRGLIRADGATRFIIGLSGLTLTAEERAFLREAEPWGLILFKRNIETPAQVAALTA